MFQEVKELTIFFNRLVKPVVKPGLLRLQLTISTYLCYSNEVKRTVLKLVPNALIFPNEQLLHFYDC